MDNFALVLLTHVFPSCVTSKSTVCPLFADPSQQNPDTVVQLRVPRRVKGVEPPSNVTTSVCAVLPLLAAYAAVARGPSTTTEVAGSIRCFLAASVPGGRNFTRGALSVPHHCLVGVHRERQRVRSVHRAVRPATTPRHVNEWHTLWPADMVAPHLASLKTRMCSQSPWWQYK